MQHMPEVQSHKLQPHICCSAADAAAYAILPGDPGRVERIAALLQDVRQLACNREYRSCRGVYKGIDIMVVSTGIGGTSTGIAVEELAGCGVTTMLRVGSCGALQPNLRLGDLLLVSGAVRDDGASRAYVNAAFPAAPDADVLCALLGAAHDCQGRYHIGFVRSHDSFYTDENAAIEAYWAQKGILGSDSESAALFVIGTLRGVRTASVLNTVVTAGGDLEDSVNAYAAGNAATAAGERQAALLALESIVALEAARNR